MRLFAWLVVGGSALAGVTLLGCPPGEPDICEGAACVGADGGGDGNQSDGSTCDPSKDPSCVSDNSGIFVNGSNGSDGAAGTKEAPLKTIGAALTKATGAKNAVYICAGTYAEHVKITSAVNLYGGFACADWTYAATNKSKVAPSDAGYALDVESVSTAISVQDLEFDSIDGTKPGDSSIAVFVNGSNVTFARDALSAGAGVAGTTGTLTTLTFPDQAVLNGNSADGGTPGAANTVDCPGDAGMITVGGAGGANNGGNGGPGLPALDGGAGGTLGVCAGPGTGQDGASAGGASTGKGASVLGQISSAGWQSAAGESGPIGGPGQGGGGGYGISGFGGGGGGAGACGGAGGGGGTGGGGSIALLASASIIAINASSLSTTAGGAGGAGVIGQSGQTPGGFHGNSTGTACVGGAGGNGGSGGAGGGGAGGVSVGVVYKGGAPTLDQATQNGISTASTGGTKGGGGISGTNDGIAGVAQPTLEIK